MRKVGITPLTIFKLYYKVLSIYKNSEYAKFLPYTVKQIKDPGIELQITGFLNKYRYVVFNDSMTEIENYFKYCFANDYSIYFNNLGAYIGQWSKDKLSDKGFEVKYVFSDKIIKYLKQYNISIKQYLEPQKKYIPRILQHYIANKEVPFEVILYLKILDRCDIDKKRLKMLLHTEFMQMKEFETKLPKLENHIKEELRRVVEWDTKERILKIQ